MKSSWRSVAAVLLASVLVLSACGSSDDDATSNGAGGSSGGGGASSETINIVGFAVPEAANKAIAAAWGETDAGKGVRFETSYGASGDQSRSVVDGLKADYVHFSVASDVTRLVDAGLVDESWNQGPNKGVVSSSVVVFAVRPGNPKNIQTWDDLIEPGIEIVTPNPASSGAARWNALAAWGHITSNGGTDDEAADFLTKLFANVVSLTNSGRDATTGFLAGTGDVLLAYENETILATQNGEELDWIYPETSILIENPGAVLIDATPKTTEWLEFVLSEAGQTEFAKKGFRPVGVELDYDEVDIDGALDPADPFPAITNLLTVEDFESWSALSKKFFDEEAGIITKIISDSGKGQ